MQNPGGEHPLSRSGVRLRAIAGHITQTLPFSPESVEEVLDLDDHVYLELKQQSKVYSLACAYIATNGEVKSFRYSPEFSTGFVDDVGVREEVQLTTIGLGLFPFTWKGLKLYGLHQTVGQPVGHGGGVDVYTSLILFARADANEMLGQFCHEIVEDSEKAQAGFVSVFEWHPTNQYWRARVVCPGRPMDSVVLERDVKDRLLADLDEFLSSETRRWYKEHGIQHKRGYLFYGVPGTGKTSMLQAVASHFEHNLCHVHLTHPRLTDESLRAAVNQTPKKSVLIFEDIDAVFGKDREKLLTADSALTFSGLLNALDGVGKADGQIIVLTTNHRERLNPALIRNGRADVHVEFTYATDQQIGAMFSRFYPFSAPSMARSFVDGLRSALDGRCVTTAALQHFFILHRRSSAAQAIDNVRDVAVELELRSDEQRFIEEDLADSKKGKSKV